MAKPVQQWQTRTHVAIRTVSLDMRAGMGARAESFELHAVADPDRRGWARFGLERQMVDEAGAADPDIVLAVSAWLIARGGRRLALYGPDNRLLAEGPIAPAELGVTDPAALATRERLISLCPSNLEAVAALGCFARVVACEDSSDFPPEVAGLERLGPDLDPDLDRVAALAPDLVLSSLSVPGMERVVTGLHARGVPQVVLAPRSLADVMAELELLGVLLQVEERATAVVTDMRRQIAELEEQAAALRVHSGPARVYLEWWPRPMFSPGRDCYSNELIRLAGGVNVFADRPGASLEIDVAALLAAEPELCFVSWCGVAEAKLDPRKLIERAGLEELAAAKAGAVHVLDEQFAGRPGPRMLEAARRMAAAIRQLRSAAEA
ncbi:MAG: ABC transporter substrate-binding protein [Myxococcales bacterium]|nr:ABC transporter substrate-binding protein [Myxococcales bacterium]